MDLREWWRRYESHLLASMAATMGQGYYWTFGTPLMIGAKWVLSTTSEEDQVLRLVSPEPVHYKPFLLCPERLLQ